MLSFKKSSTNSIILFTFIGFVSYFILMGFVNFRLQAQVSRRDREADILRMIAFNALAFNEENYHTQLEMWEYAYEPNEKRLKAFRSHADKFNELLIQLKSKVTEHKQLLHLDSEEQVRLIFLASKNVQQDWQNILQAIAYKRSDREVKQTILEAEENFDKLMFNKRIGDFVKSAHEKSELIELENKEFSWFYYYVGLFEILVAIIGAVFSLFYIKRLQKAGANQQAQILSSSKFAALGEMAGGVAHEINNPLAAIKSISGQLLEVVDDDPLDKSLLKEMASKIERTTDRIAKIVSGMRSFSRDGSKDEFQLFDLCRMVEDTLSFCQERFKSNNIQLYFEKSRNEIYVEGRETEISQAVLNLLNNACDAISGYSEKWIKVVLCELADRAEIRVTDCGNQISSEIQEKIFQPFFTTKPIGKGTGLGLSISLGIIKDHGGQLLIMPEEKNTCFVIRLPVKQMSEKNEAA